METVEPSGRPPLEGEIHVGDRLIWYSSPDERIALRVIDIVDEKYGTHMVQLEREDTGERLWWWESRVREICVRRPEL